MIIMSFMMLAGIGIRALCGTHPELGPIPTKAPDQAIIQFFTRDFPPILGAFLVVGILYALMSTADGLYLVISTAITTDIYRALLDELKKVHYERGDSFHEGGPQLS
jgi:sodium/pantothenate symporter